MVSDIREPARETGRRRRRLCGAMNDEKVAAMQMFTWKFSRQVGWER